MATETDKLTPFQQAIKDHLDARAQTDELFAATYAKPGKTLKGCCAYIEQEVKKSGRCGFADEEIYGMAVHYYDEDDIKEPTTSGHCTVVINKEVQLSDKEKADLKARAKADFLAQQRAQLAKQEAERMEKQKRAEERRKKAAEERRQKANELQLDLFGGL